MAVRPGMTNYLFPNRDPEFDDDEAAGTGGKQPPFSEASQIAGLPKVDGETRVINGFWHTAIRKHHISTVRDPITQKSQTVDEPYLDWVKGRQAFEDVPIPNSGGRVERYQVDAQGNRSVEPISVFPGNPKAKPVVPAGMKTFEQLMGEGRFTETPPDESGNWKPGIVRFPTFNDDGSFKGMGQKEGWTPAKPESEPIQTVREGNRIFGVRNGQIVTPISLLPETADDRLKRQDERIGASLKNAEELNKVWQEREENQRTAEQQAKDFEEYRFKAWASGNPEGQPTWEQFLARKAPMAQPWWYKLPGATPFAEKLREQYFSTPAGQPTAAFQPRAGGVELKATPFTPNTSGPLLKPEYEAPFGGAMDPAAIGKWREDIALQRANAAGMAPYWAEQAKKEQDAKNANLAVLDWDRLARRSRTTPYQRFR